MANYARNRLTCWAEKCIKRQPHEWDSLDSPSYLAEAQKIGRRKISDGSIYTGDEEAIHQTMIELSDVLNVGNRIERTRQMIAFIDRIDNNEMADIVQNFSEAGWVDYNRSEFSMLISAWMDRDRLSRSKRI